MTTTTDKPAGPGPEEKTELKTLDYYLEHPNEMPTDAAAIEQLFEAHQAAHPDAAGDTPPAGEKPKVEAKPADKPAGEPKIEGVLTKDGQHVIPYAEMERRINEATESKEAEAVARKAAEDYAHQLEANIREVNDRIKALEAGGAKPADAPVTMELPKELMDTLKSEFPTIAKAVEAQQALLKHAAEKLEAVEKRIGSAERERTQDVESEVESLIGRVPELQAWREKTPYLFARAQAVEGDLFKDKAFMDAHPELQNDDVARYKEVVKRVKQEIGLPATPDPSPEDKRTEQEKADAIVAGTKPTAPNSLSDLPAGKPPSTPSESLENLSAVEIGNRFMGMTPEKIQEQLARL
jgi:hypothetical protein